ncbi:class I adenylate-forming enzyme family protein [Novosphingobium sp. Chol11]|uniref:class I adenylate-forming enzyme family protein n=1 Tax=Novosphingobium sp. Chol11 TaxID=1385763 RepID=UPI000BE298ED|nr:AMP-binding protein [Novosphingobium sp. Chol11]
MASKQIALRWESHHGRVVRCIADRPSTIGALFASVVARASERTGLVDGDCRLTYGQMDERASCVAGNLAALGIGKGDRVALLLDNRWEFMVAMLACIRLGAIFVPMNFRQRMPELAFALNDCGAVMIIHEATMSGEIPPDEEVPALRHRITVGQGGNWSMLTGPAPLAAAPEIDEDDPLCILYTSGTTGKPKGAVLTHLGVIHNVLLLVHHAAIGDGFASILAIPASHVAGLVVKLLPSLAVGGRLVMQRDFKASRFLELAQAERIDWAILVPAMYNLCLREPDFDGYDLSSWRVGTFGGAPMPEAVAKMLAAKLPHMVMHNIYGATETSAPAVILPSGAFSERSDWLGRPILCCDMIVMSDDGRELPRGEAGELWIGGPMVIPGYWRRPDADAEAFVGGYWRSGDIGVMDEDGYVRVCDRKKDMIIRGGFKVYSVEVENVLASHPLVVEAAVTGYACPVLGERVAATVRVSGDVDVEALRAFCASLLSDYKIPERFELIGAPLPRNANGKLQKMLLRK